MSNQSEHVKSTIHLCGIILIKHYLILNLTTCTCRLHVDVKDNDIANYVIYCIVKLLKIGHHHIKFQIHVAIEWEQKWEPKL